MDIRKIKKLIELVEESGIAFAGNLEGEESVRISRNFSGQVSVAPSDDHAPGPAQVAATGCRCPAAAAAPAADAALNGHLMRSPMVGTFYLAVADRRPSWKSGQHVNVSATPGIIVETMKMMNKSRLKPGGVMAIPG